MVKHWALLLWNQIFTMSQKFVWCLLHWYTTGVKSVHSQWLAINIGKLPFPWNAQFSFLKSIILFLSCRFEDISQVSMPRENIFELTAEHKTYKVYTPKVIFNWTDLFHHVRSCCALKQGSKTLVDMCMCFKVTWSTSNFMIPISKFSFKLYCQSASVNLHYIRLACLRTCCLGHILQG